jgi:hypothetical protein
MSIEHRAYLLDYHAFAEELEETLTTALEELSISGLRTWIDERRALLRTPYRGTPLPVNWWEELESSLRDYDAYFDDVERRALMRIQRLAKICIGRYTEDENLGLSYGFDALCAYLESIPTVARIANELICGTLFGPSGRRLDLGALGTGFVLPGKAERMLRYLERELPPPPPPGDAVYANCHYKPDEPGDVPNDLEKLRTLYRRAVAKGKGILFEDFNDRGTMRL